jgi:hypothetical protein
VDKAWEPLFSPADSEAISEAPSTVRVDSIPLHGGSSGMQDMLYDVFAMHDVCVEVGGSQFRVEAEAKAELWRMKLKTLTRGRIS